MKSSYIQVPLHQVITQDENYIHELEPKLYPKLSVKLYGRGVVLDSPADAVTVKMKRHQLAKPGQVILSEIWAKKGAIGLVPPEGAGALATSHFFLFDIDQSKMIPEYMNWLLKGNYFAQDLNAEARGTTGYAAVRPKQFLQLTIPLPPLDEQRRIVARIEALAGRVAEAQRLRAAAIAEVEALVLAKEMEIWPNEWLNDAPTLADVTQHLARGRQSKQGESNHYLIKTRHVQMGEYVRSDMMLDADIVEKVNVDAFAQYGDILIACSAAGCLGRVAQFDVIDQIASTDTHVAIARANPEIVLPEYLYAYLRGSQGQYQLRSRERGDWQREKISFRLTELNMNDLQKVPVPVPSFEEQRRIVAYMDGLHAKVGQVRRYQDSTQAELDALLPAILDKAFRGEL